MIYYKYELILIDNVIYVNTIILYILKYKYNNKYFHIICFIFMITWI